MQKKDFKVDVYDLGNYAATDAYAQLMGNIVFKCEKMSVNSLCVCSYDPKEGKTTIAINLSISMARAGWNTLFVDADTRKPMSYKRLGNHLLTGLSDIINDDLSITEALMKTKVPNLYYLSKGNKENNPVEMLCSPNFEIFLKTVQKGFDFIILDTPALSTVIDGSLIASKIDTVLLVAEMGSTTTTNLRKAIQQIEMANGNIVGIALNRATKSEYKNHTKHYDYFNNLK